MVSSGGSYNYSSDLIDLGRSHKLCISNKFVGDADYAGLPLVRNAYM